MSVFITACTAAEQPDAILQRLRENVAEQLSHSANYTCTETLDRSYYRNNGFAMAMHGPDAVAVRKNELIHDRLRLDVAVSEGKEIYGWHGAGQFSSSEVTDIVQHGPISTGQFVGYLRNVFLADGVKFKYRGTAVEDGERVHKFDFVVKLSSSRSLVHTASGYRKVPFHGSASARASNLELSRLEIVDDEIPHDSEMESVRTDLRYQTAKLFGRDALIPSVFVLQIQDTNHVFTVSRGNYSECHEFGSEATLRFTDFDENARTDATAPKPIATLPPGVTLPIALQTEITDETAYAGDPVKATLSHAVRIPGANDKIPKNAVLNGIITRFVAYFQPEMQYDVRIEFRRLSFGDRSYRLKAVHEPSKSQFYPAYGSIVPEVIRRELREGSMLIDSKHVRLHKNYRGNWITVDADAKGSTDRDLTAR